ncbi:hypothetical protein [Novosphingobium sp.]|uniref:hypothetical protein n=1 Tax=Novosphingobium sp. TaxID=1874826 RepID=UPI0025E65344|nr:hypothetical protein [Novosphingobium sp.]
MRKFLTSIALAALATAAAQANPGGNGKGEANGPAGHGGGALTIGQMHSDIHGKAAKADRGSDNDRTDERGPIKETRTEKGRSAGLPQSVRNNEDSWKRPVDYPGQGNNAGFAKTERDERGSARTAIKGRVTSLPRIDWKGYDSRSLVDGCPPGLAKKNNGCTPPGLAKADDDWTRYDANWWGLRGLTGLNGYRYVDGNLVRLGSGGAVSGYYPLLGGALAIGNVWPSSWLETPVSPYYVDYYGLGEDYRYFDGALYRLDPQTQAIETVAALLTGDTFVIGQRVPEGYGVYNVPVSYRDRYVDGPDAVYRYSDGYVYEIDPTTQLVAAAINLLT